jgi:hypothetical protein
MRPPSMALHRLLPSDEGRAEKTARHRRDPRRVSAAPSNGLDIVPVKALAEMLDTDVTKKGAAIAELGWPVKDGRWMSRARTSAPQADLARNSATILSDTSHNFFASAASSASRRDFARLQSAKYSPEAVAVAGLAAT